MSNIVLPFTSSLSAGLPRDVTELTANFDACAAVINGDIDNSNYAADAAIRDSKLASANNGLWKTILKGCGILGAAAAHSTVRFPTQKGSFLLNGAAPNLNPPPEFYWHAGTVTELEVLPVVPNKTAKLRVGLTLAVNGTAPTGATFFGYCSRATNVPGFGTHGLTHAGSFANTPGLLSPPANTITGPDWSPEIDFPAAVTGGDCLIPLFYFVGANLPAGCVVMCQILIQMRNA